MDSLDNIFSVPIPITDNLIDDNWLLRVSNPNSNSSSSTLPLTLQLLQQHYFNVDNNNNNNNNNNNTFDFQTTNTNTNININEIINDPIENPQIKEQLLLLQQQHTEQQQQVQQHLIDYQMQQEQSFQLRQQQFYSHDNNNIQPSVTLPTITNDSNINDSNINNNNNNNIIITNNINPVSDQQILNSMKTIEPISISTITDTNSATTLTTKQPKKKTTKTTTITTTTTTTTKEDNNTAATLEDRNKFYHKKHREKKKGYVKEMEDKIAALAFENQQLAKENKSLKINGESVENMVLFDEESTSVCYEAVELTLKMKDALDNNDERSLIYLIKQFHMSMPRLILEIVRYTDHIFHPNFQVLLNIISYVPHTEPARYDILTGPGSNIWIEEFKKDAKLTLEQSIKLDELRLEFKKIEDQCLAERLELDKEIKRILGTHFMFLPKNPLEITQDDLALPYSASNFNQPALDLRQSLEIVCKLNSLKNKVILGRINTLHTFAKICRILNHVQEAKFLIVVHQEDENFSFGMLNLVWNNLGSSGSLFGIAEQLEKMVNSSQRKDNNSNSVAPFSLKPATFNIN